MDFYFTDRKFNLLGVASTSGSTDISLANEEDKLSIEDSVRTLTGSLFYGPESRKQVEAMSALGNYVLYKDESGRSVWTTIMEINNDPLAGECVFLAEDAGVDLINELVGPYTADKAYPIASYISRFTADSGFKIGVNEISNLNRKLEWESEESTALARILSVATQFDNAELEFRFEVNGLQVVERYIDIFKKRGRDERVTLYVDKDINRITTSGNLYELGTSLVGIGGTPEGQDNPINLKGYKYTDPEGRYVLGSDGIMRDTVAVQKWSRLLSNDNPTPTSSHIQRRKTYETTDQKTLCDDVLRDLKKMAEVELNYEAEIVSLPYGVKIGDTIYLVDEQGELYLSARVLELVRCYSEDRYLATLGNYLIKDSGVDVNLQELADKLKDQIKPGDTYYPWIRYADDANGTGMSSVPEGKTYMATVYRKNDPIASDNPEDYAGQWVKVKGEDGSDGEDGKDGEQGPQGNPGPPGADGQDGLPGKDGLGIVSTQIMYAGSDSGTVKPTSGWTASVPTLAAGKYLWTETTWLYSDNTGEAGYSVSRIGKDGNTGKDGIAGKDGVGISNTVIEYVGAVSGTSKPTSGWSNTIPTVPQGQYLWTRTTWTYTDGTKEQGYSTALMGPKGDKGDTGAKGTDGKDGAQGVPGEKGADGKTSYLHTGWKMADGTFTTDYPGENIWLSSNPQFLKPNWVYGADNKSFIYNVPNTAVATFYLNKVLKAAFPDDEGVGRTFTVSFDVESQVEGLQFSNGNMYINDSLIVAHNRPTLVVGEKKRVYASFVYKKASSDTSVVHIYITAPSTLVGNIIISGVKVEVGENTNPIHTPAPSEDYTLAYPKWRGEYTDFTAADSTNPDDYTWTAYLGQSGQDGNNGADGVGIANTKIDYQLHTSATTPPTGTWVTSPPAVTVGKYLWTRTILEYTDGTKSTPAYSVSGGPGANGSDGKDGQDGAPGVDALPIFSGYVTNEAIVLMATNSGAVSDFSKATGTFVTYLGQDQLTSGVTYSRVSQSGVTATINTTTGAYSVTAASADSGMVVFKAVYQGIELQKIVSVTKAKQGAVGATGAPGADGATGDTGPQGPPTGVVAQDTVPDTPYIGMLWQCTGNIAGYINPATYRWNGSAWEIYQFTAQNILAETFTGFVFRGVEFIGSKFVSEFRYSIGDGQYYYADGTTTIDNGGLVTDLIEHYPTDPEEYDESFSRHIELSPQNALYMKLKGLRSDLSQEIQLSPGGLMLKDNDLMATLTVENIYSLVRPARRNTSPADDTNRKGVVVNYFRVGNLVNVAIKFELLKDTGWVALAPSPPSGYSPASMYQASGVAGSVSYRGQTCMVYCNTDGLRLIPTTGQGAGVFQLSLTWTTNDPFPYGDS